MGFQRRDEQGQSPGERSDRGTARLDVVFSPCSSAPAFAENICVSTPPLGTPPWARQRPTPAARSGDEKACLTDKMRTGDYALAISGLSNRLLPMPPLLQLPASSPPPQSGLKDSPFVRFTHCFNTRKESTQRFPDALTGYCSSVRAVCVSRLRGLDHFTRRGL